MMDVLVFQSILGATQDQENCMSSLAVPVRAGFASLRAIGSFFANFTGGIHEGLIIRDRYDRLARLSNAELRRHGLDRSTIAQAAIRGFDVD
jgi:hypothetical protein